MAIPKIKLDPGTVYQKEKGGIYYFHISGQRSTQGNQPQNS